MRLPPSVPMLAPLAGFVAGVLAAFYGAGLAVALTLAAVALLLLAMRRTAGAALAAMTVAGWLCATFRASGPLPDDLGGRPMQYSAEITRVADRSDGHTIEALIDSAAPPGSPMHAVRPFKAQIVLKSSSHRVTDTRRLRWRGELEPLDSCSASLRYPLVTDFSRGMRRRGVVARTIVLADSITSITERPGLYPALRRLRDNLEGLIFDAPLSPGARSLLPALLLGDTSMLPPDVRTSYAAAGLSHILALSGMHVAIIVMVVSAILAPLRLMRHGRTVAGIALTLLLWVYAAITGLSPSVVRAVTMMTLYVIGRVLQRYSTPWNSLCAAALLILIVDPRALFSMGFQLTFAAVASILAFAHPLNPVDRREHGTLYAIASWLLVCLAAVAGTSLIAAWHLGVFPLYFLLPALAATLLLPVIVTGALAVMALQACGLQSLYLCRVIDLAVSALDATGSFTASLPGALVEGIRFSGLTLALALGALAAFALWANVRTRATAAAALMTATAALLSVLLTTPPRDTDDCVTLMPATGRAALLVRQGPQVWIWSPEAYLQEHEALLEEARLLYSDWLRACGISPSAVKMLPDSLLTTERALPFHGTSIAFYPTRGDVVVLPRRFDPSHLDSLSGSRLIVVPAGFSAARRRLVERAAAGAVSRTLLLRHSRDDAPAQRETAPAR